MPQATPLPPNPYDQTTQPPWHDAYNTCVWLEGAEAWTTFLGDDLIEHMSTSGEIMFQTGPQVAGLTLGYALILAISDDGRDNVAREINTCKRDPEILAGLTHLYIFGLIRIFRNPKGPTPCTSSDLSPRLSFQAAVDDHARDMVPPGQTPQWLKDKVMERDEYRCIFTGRPDDASKRRGVATYLPERQQFGSVVAQVAHIISQSLTEGVGGLSDEAQKKLRWASSAAAVLDRFAGIEIRKILDNLNVYLPINTMISSYDPHTWFDELGLWLTPAVDVHGDVIANTYDVNMLNHEPGFILPRIHFRDDKEVPPPHPTLLAIHAACAKIAHTSGAAEVLEDFYGGGDAPHGLSLSRQDMSVNSRGAAELERALRRVVVGA